MIDHLILTSFKNFSNELIKVGPFSLILGANASGKSNIRDAFRFLHGLGRGYTLSEAIGGKYGDGGQLEWREIRGGPRYLTKIGEEVFTISTVFRSNEERLDFLISAGQEVLGADTFRVWIEDTSINEDQIYRWEADKENVSLPGFPEDFMDILRRDQPILTQIHSLLGNRNKHQLVPRFIDMIASMRFLDLVPDRMREPSYPSQIVMGDRGENLPSVLNDICADKELKQAMMEWIRELTPMDVVNLEFPRGPDGRIHLMLNEKDGTMIPAYAASDGTLRFLAMIAALLVRDPSRLYFFEEIDNGIHPSRLRLLVDLIETQTAKGHIQVVATTHSPELLSIVNDETFKHTSVVCRREGTSDAIIRPVSEIPNAVELRKSQGLGRLLAGGWMETALAFTEEDEDGEEMSG